MKNFSNIFIILLTVVMSLTFVNAETSDTTEILTVDEAIDRAVKYSRTLKNIEENEYLTNETYFDLVDDLRLATEHVEILNLSVQLKQANAKMQNYKLSDQIERENIRLSLTKFFNSVINAQRELELFDESLELAKKELDIAKVKCGLGMISQSDYDNKNLDYNKMIIERESKKTAIDEAFVSLNKVLGADFKKTYTLELDLEYAPLDDLDVNTYVNNALATSQSILSKQSDLEIAQYDLKTYSSLTSPLESKDAKTIKVSQLSRDLGEEKVSVQEKVITLYNNIISTENSYKSNLLTLKNMEKQLEIKKAQYDLNRITLLDVENYEYQIKQLNNTIMAQKNSHEILIMQLKNPNLL